MKILVDHMLNDFSRKLANKLTIKLEEILEENLKLRFQGEIDESIAPRTKRLARFCTAHSVVSTRSGIPLLGNGHITITVDTEPRFNVSILIDGASKHKIILKVEALDDKEVYGDGVSISSEELVIERRLYL